MWGMARLLESWGREREVCQDVGARGGASRPQGEAGGRAGQRPPIRDPEPGRTAELLSSFPMG